MKHSEAIFTPESESSEERDIETALFQAGFFHTEAPRPGTKAYKRIVEAAENYMREVQYGEKAISTSRRTDAENYFVPQRSSSSPSDSERRHYHDQLAELFFGKSRKQLSKADAAKVSNFAAYLTGHEEYVDTW